VATTQRTATELRPALLEVSTPGSARFRKHYSVDEAGVLAMDPVDVARARAWAASKGFLRRATRRGEFFTVTANVSVWEAALGCEFYDFVSASRVVTRCDGDYDESSLPAGVEAVFGVSDLPPRTSKRRRGPPGAIATGNEVTPQVLNAFYRVDSNAGSDDVFQGVFETSSQNYSPADLRIFADTFDISDLATITDVGGHASDSCSGNVNACSEGNLDVQYVVATSQTSPTTYYYTDAANPFLAFAQYVADLTTAPFVGSISWSSIEAEVSDAVKTAFDREVLKAALTGSSIFVSSGDDGVASFAATSADACKYEPSFPATSPFVVAVGATYNADYSEPGRGEVACQSDKHSAVITSGGGFSTFYEAPDFTRGAIDGYFDGLFPDAVSGYNRSGRAYPDLSLSGYSYLVVIGGDLYAVSGTSCSAPAVAAFASLVNAVRVEAGAEGLGYLLPQLYHPSSAAVFNDVTRGDNHCVAQNAFCCDQGFKATSGWDPVTGLGSLDYAAFEKAFTSDLDAAEVARAKRRLALRREVRHQGAVFPSEE